MRTFRYAVLYTLTLKLLVASASNLASAAKVTVEPSDRGAIVRVDGELFTEYLTKSGHQPVLWPMMGPTGKPVTRSFPVGPLLKTEQDDHPHHHSLWFAHQDVNGHDFWLEPKANLPTEKAHVIRHVDFLRIANVEDFAVLATNNQWLAGKGNIVCEDQRTLTFVADANSRSIHFRIKISATNGPVTLGDIKDGTFSVRVAGTMKVDSGGTLVNSLGQKNANAWGMPAEWVDNYGPLDGETVGIAMFSHPLNFQHPCRWHARNYGLLCANPFGDRDFPQAQLKQHRVTIKSGESLELQYCVFLHQGDTEQGKVKEAFNFFANRPLPGSRDFYLVDNFESDLKNWEPTDADQPQSVWSIESAGQAGKQNHHLRVSGKSTYQPPVRSPHSIAWLKSPHLGSFELTAKVQSTHVEAGPHRDLCLFWGCQDPSHFYYVHLGAKPDPHSSQIFIVDGADRRKITYKESAGIPWTDGWHQVKVRHHAEIGLMQVYFDDIQNPVMTAIDTTFASGRIGLGTFDDHGNFDDIVLRGKAIRPQPSRIKFP